MIRSLDHLVLTVANLDATLAFYTEALGMTHVTFGGRHALTFGTQKINLHVAGREFSPRAHKATVGSGDLCFLIDGSLEKPPRVWMQRESQSKKARWRVQALADRLCHCTCAILIET